MQIYSHYFESMSGAHLGIERLNAAVGHVSLRCVPSMQSEIGFCIRLVRLHNVRTAHTDNGEDLSESVAIPIGDLVDVPNTVDMQSTWPKLTSSLQLLW